MGAAQSKAIDSEKDAKELKASNILDILATKYILTQNFQDMKKLGDREYCNKLVILTADIIKKFLMEKEISYVTQRVVDGVPVNSKKSASVIYLSTNKLKQNTKTKTYTKRVPDGSYREVLQEPYKQSKTLLSELDVKNAVEKDNMCKGIAKFYIKIAHLFAAILKAVNPIYQYNGHEMSIMNKSKIPKGVRVKLSEVNLCNRRIKTLKSETTESGKVKVRVNNCNLNRKITTKQLQGNILDNLHIDYGEEVVKNKTLGQEIGVPELEKLYYDIYDFGKGKFNAMSKKSRSAYNQDLRVFYQTFTGKSNYYKWNASGKKKFGDIPLDAYHESEQCKDKHSAWHQSYEGSSSNPLFIKFADNVKAMLANTKINQAELLLILDKLFVWVDTPSKFSGDSSLENKTVTINPKLTSKSLQILVEQSRNLIIKIYLQCETEYRSGLKIFEAIVGERILKNGIAKKKALEEQLEKVIVGQNDPELDKILQQSVNKTMASAAMSGGKKNRTRKKKCHLNIYTPVNFLPVLECSLSFLSN